MEEDKGGVWGTLSSKSNWTSEELGELLEKETERRGLLASQKEVAEKEVARLHTKRNKDVRTELEELQKSFSKLKSGVNKLAKDKLPNRLQCPEFYRHVEEADELEKASAYLTVLRAFTLTSNQIEANIESELESEAVALFHRLKTIELVYLNTTECTNLQIFCKGIISFWEYKLRLKLVKDFEGLLEAFGWPMRIKTASPTLEMHEKFHRAVLNLSKISSTATPEDAENDNHDEKEEFVPIIPIQTMMVPLKRRFRFHFLSDKPTSESSRPEWYFSQVKTWLQELIPFVKTHLEKVTVSEVCVSSVIEFIRCVSEMLILKVEAHLKDERDVVFVKVLEEAIAYENEIGDYVIENVSLTNSYLPAFVNTIFSSPEILSRWLNAERRACLEKLDEMFASATAWNKPVIPGPPEIVDLFIAVIRSLTDRFAHLQNLPQRLQFVELLNDLLEEFHLRCLQMWKSKTEFDNFLSKDVLIDYVIADALYYVHDTLQEWEYLPFFASLSLVDSFQTANNSNGSVVGSSQRFESESIESGKENSLFAEACTLFWCLCDEIQSKWCSKIFRKLKEEFQPYCKLKWQCHVSTSAICDRPSEQLLRPLQTLKDIGNAVSSSMDPKCAEKWMKKLAVRLDQLLIETVVLPNQFNQPGAQQLYFDFNKGIFPVFWENGVYDKLFFGSVISALTILKLSTGEAMLLYDTLMNGNFEAHEIALAELNISICQSEAIKILRNRCDLHL